MLKDGKSNNRYLLYPEIIKNDSTKKTSNIRFLYIFGSFFRTIVELRLKKRLKFKRILND
jgi:hypothetical protein